MLEYILLAQELRQEIRKRTSFILLIFREVRLRDLSSFVLIKRLKK